MAEGSKYPQINVNTSVSVAVVVLLLGGGTWLAAAKSEINEATNQIKTDLSYHEKRLSAAESSLAQSRSSEVILERRLLGIEYTLKDILNKLPQADRR